MRSMVVEVVAAGTCFQAGVRLAQQVKLVEILVSKLAVETLAQTVLPRRTWLDVQYLNSDCCEPLLNRCRNELGSVVAAKPFGNTMHREQLRQRVDCVFTGDAAASLDAQANTRVLVDDIKETNRTSVQR